MGASIRATFTHGLYTAELAPLSETEGWQEGLINPGPLDEDRLHAVINGVLRSMTEVAPEDMNDSDCTDGRKRQKLEDGTAVPIRQKTVGADTMTAFGMAEALGTRFYGNDKATPTERVGAVASFLSENGIRPCTHGHCGAAGGFVPVLGNIIKFSKNANFIQRQQEFVPAFDARLFEQMIGDFGQRLSENLYEGYSDALVTAAVMDISGPRAIAHYIDDGTGVKGHNELLIARIRDTGDTVSVNRLAEISDGLQVFTVNDTRINRLAELFGRGRDEDYVTALMAGEAFSDVGHGTLGSNLRTLTIRKIA